MGIPEFLKTNAKWLMVAIPAATAMWIFGDGKIMSWEVPDVAVAVALGVSWYIFDMLRKDLVAAESKNNDLEKRMEEIKTRVQQKKRHDMMEQGGPFEEGIGEMK